MRVFPDSEHEARDEAPSLKDNDNYPQDGCTEIAEPHGPQLPNNCRTKERFSEIIKNNLMRITIIYISGANKQETELLYYKTNKLTHKRKKIMAVKSHGIKVGSIQLICRQETYPTITKTLKLRAFMSVYSPRQVMFFSGSIWATAN